MSNSRTQHHVSSNQARDSVLGFREHLLAEFRRGGSSLHPLHAQPSRKSPASHHSRETSTDSYFIPSKRRYVDPRANAHHTLSSSSALLHENTSGMNISSRSSYLYRGNTGDNNDLDISAMTAHDARLAHGGVNMPPTSRPTNCHHSYVEYFVDQCLARGVPEEIIAQHALYMIHSMRDGIYLYSELHRHRQNEAQLEHDMQDLSLQLMKSSRATSRATSPQQRRLLRSSGTMTPSVATTRSPAPSSPKVAHEPSLSAAAAAAGRQQSSGRVNLPSSVDVSPESVMFRFPSPSRGGGAAALHGESVSVLDDVLETPPQKGREGEVHSGGSFSERPVVPTDELRLSDAVAKRLDLRDDGIEHRAAHPQQPTRSSASTARNLAPSAVAGPTSHQSTKSSMMEYNRTHRRVDPSSSSRHVAAPRQENGPTASRESQAGRPSSQTGTQQSRGPPPPSKAADVVYTSRRTVTSNEILQRTTTTIQQPKPRGGNDVFSQHRLAEASSGTSGGLRRGSAVNSSSATLQRRPSFSSAGSFRIERNESQAQLVDRLSTPKKNSTLWHQEATVESTMQMRQPSEVNIVQPQSPPPPPPPLVHTAPVLLVPTTDPVSYRSRSSTSSVPLSPLELPGGSNRGPSTASAASSKVDARCFTRDEKQQGRENSSFASAAASTTASTSAPPPGRSGQLSSTAPPSPTLLASTSRPTMNTQQQHRTQTAINAASFSSPPQHDRNTFSGGSVIDESPLIVPRRRRGAAASSTTSTAVPLSHHQSPHITTGVATASTATFVARTTASSISSAVAAPLMQHSGGAAAWNRSDSKAYASDGRKWHHSILVDDATQSSETGGSGGGGSGTPPSNNGLLRGFPQRDIGDVFLEPPQSESPKLLRYLADTRNALAMIPPTLSSRRGSPLPQTNQRFMFELNRTSEPSARFSVSPNPAVVGGSYNTATTTQDSRPFEDDVVFVVKREGSPLRWQKRSAPSHTTFTTSVRHDDTDEDCISDLSSGDDDENSMMRMAPQRKVLFSGGSSVSGGRLRSPVW